MVDLNSLINELPIDASAARLGTDPDTARQAVSAALPALLGGMEANAADPDGDASLTRAVGQHSPALVQGGVDIDDVDTADGEAITRHVFGTKTDAVAAALGSTGGSGVTSGLMGKLLPMLAPIVMSYLASRLMGGGSDAKGSSSGGGVGDILGQILGGGGGSASAGSVVSDVLGGLLGGGRR
ncbi:MAG: DUF937 domain-containing protein [Acidimicrobiales bacterium]